MSEQCRQFVVTIPRRIQSKLPSNDQSAREAQKIREEHERALLELELSPGDVDRLHGSVADEDALVRELEEVERTIQAFKQSESDAARIAGARRRTKER